MASPLKSLGKFLFGAPSTPSVIQPAAQAAAPPPPSTDPVGNAGTNKPSSGPSFLSSAAAGATGQTGQKTLLGQ